MPIHRSREERSLLRAITDDLDSPAPRLAYANWLTEHGQGALGDFIRIDCELEKLHPFDPRWSELNVRRTDVWFAHAAEWTRALGRLGVEQSDVEHGLDKGMFGEIRVRSWKIFPGRAKQILELAPTLRKLEISWEPTIEDVNRIFASPYLARFKSLTLEARGDMAKKDLEILATSPHVAHLSSLRIRLCNLGDGASAIRALAGSRYLTHLKSLEFDSCDLEAYDIVPLFSSPCLGNLKLLGLVNNNLGDEGVRLLAGAVGLPSLTHLDIWEKKICDNGVRALAESSNFSRLRALRMGYEMGPASIKVLANSRLVTRLTRLNLFYNRLGPEGAKALAHSRSLTRLTDLNLGSNRIGPDGAKAIAASPILRRVNSLDLSDNAIGDFGCAALARSRYLSRLKTLNLRDNRIRDGGAQALVTGGNGLVRLRHLDLFSNPVRAVESVRSLADAKKVLLTVTEPVTRQDDAGLVKTLWAWVKQHELLAWKPVVKRGDGSATASKFGGTPWLGRGESWPVCGSCRQSMQLLVQLNLGQLPKKADRFGRGLLQLFYCTNYENINCGSSRKSHFVRIVESHAAAPRADIPATIQAQHDQPRTIIGWKERLDYPSLKELRKLGLAKCGLVNHKQLDFRDDENPPAMEKLDRCITSDKLAGWPKWPQGVNRPKCPQCKERMELLFQLASDDNTPQIFGDDGFGYTFQCQSHKDAVAFSWESY